MVRFACLDLVEDRSRARVIGVMMIFCFYVLLQSALTATSDEPPEPIVGEFTVASSMPAVIDVFTPLAHELKLLTKSDNGSAMIGRAITGVVAMVVQATPPLYTLDCDSARLHSLRGTMYAMQRTQACQPRLSLCGLANGSHPSCVTTDFVPAVSDALPATAMTFHQYNNLTITHPLVNLTKFNGHVEAHTDDVGLASFSGLVVEGGPTPSKLELRFSAGDSSSASTLSRVSSDVAILEVDPTTSPVSMHPGFAPGPFIRLGVPFENNDGLRAPAVYVRSMTGEPLRNRTVVAFGWQHPNFFASWAPTNFAKGIVEFKSHAATRHHLRGQGFTLLDNAVSLPTDEQGRAVFEKLTVRSASSRFFYLMFYCDGIIANWMDPGMTPLASGLPSPPRYVSPLYITSEITSIQLVDKDGSPIDCSAAMKPMFSFVYPPWVTPQGTTTYMSQEEPPQEPFYVKVGRHTEDGGIAPLEGVEVMAVVYEASGAVFPFMEEPNVDEMFASSNGQVYMQPPKRLRNALSTPADANGVASFEHIAWTDRGKPDRMISNFGFVDAHRIAFCVPGATAGASDITAGADSRAPEGCALSCPIHVVSRVVTIRWSTQPLFHYIRIASAPADSFLPGEIAAKATDMLAPVPTVQLLDENGVGVPDQTISKLFLFDVVHCRLLCDDTSEVDDAAWLRANPAFCVPCINFVTERSKQEHASLKRNTSVSSDGLTGPDGLLTLPVVFESINMAYVPTLMQRATLGRIRLLVRSGIDVYSPLSEPVRGFSYAAALLSDNSCTSLDAVSVATKLLVEDSIAGNTVPSVDGGAGVTDGCLAYDPAANDNVFPVDSSACNVSSIVYPYSGRPPLPYELVDLSTIQDIETQMPPELFTNGNLLTPDTEGLGALLHASLWSSSVLGPSLAMQAMGKEFFTGEMGAEKLLWNHEVPKLIARDALGRPVPGLRVRLRNLQTSLYPQLPESYHVVTCGLNPRCASKLRENAGLPSSPTPAPPLTYADDGQSYEIEIAAAVLSTDEIMGRGLKITYTDADGGVSVWDLPRSPVQLSYNAWYGDVDEANCVGIAKPTATDFGPSEYPGFRSGYCYHELAGANCSASGPISAYIDLKPSPSCGSTESSTAAQIMSISTSGSKCHVHIEVQMPFDGSSPPLSWAESCCRINSFLDDPPSASEEDMIDVCETGADGTVDMVIAKGLHGGKWGEFVSSGPSGSVPLRYEAYKVNDDGSTTLACASETFSVGVSSETSKIVFSALGSDELPIDLLQPEQDWTALDMRHVVDPATGSTINFKVQSEEPVSAGHFIGQPDFGDKVFPSFQNAIGYKVHDQSLNAIPLAGLDGFDFVHAPPYLRGFEAASTSCETFENCYSSAVLEETAGLILPPMKVYDYGHYEPTVTATASPIQLYPTRKHTTYFVRSGISKFAAWVHPGNPGLYGVVAISNGVRSPPIFFEVINQLAGGRIEVVTEPDPCLLDYNVMLGNTARNTSPTDAVCGWAIGSILINKSPEVRLLGFGEDGAEIPLPNYRALVRAVDGPTDDAKPVDDVRFDITNTADDDPRFPFDSPFAARMGTYADAEGISRFPGLVLFDAADRTCFYLQFYFASKDDMSDAVYKTSQTKLCAGAELSFSVTSQPSPSMVLETPFIEAPAVRSDAKMIEVAALGGTRLWMETAHTFLGVADMSMQIYAVNEQAFEVPYVRTFLTDRFASYPRCVAWLGVEFVGGCPVLACTKSGDDANPLLSHLNGISACSKAPEGASRLTFGKLRELVPQLGAIFDFMLTSGATSAGEIFAKDPASGEFTFPDVQGAMWLELRCRLGVVTGECSDVSTCKRTADDVCPVALKHVHMLVEFISDFLIPLGISADVLGATYDPEMAQGLEENLLKLGLSTISSWVAQNAASVWYDVVRETLLWYSEPLVTEGGAAEVPVGFLEFRFDELRLGGFDAPDFNFQFSAAGSMPYNMPADAAITSPSTVTTEPSGIAMLTQPPLSVQVGDIFLMDVKVTIKSGTPLPTSVAYLQDTERRRGAPPRPPPAVERSPNPLAVSRIPPVARIRRYRTPCLQAHRFEATQSMHRYPGGAGVVGAGVPLLGRPKSKPKKEHTLRNPYHRSRRHRAPR
jgi:hypothetical protein